MLHTKGGIGLQDIFKRGCMMGPYGGANLGPAGNKPLGVWCVQSNVVDGGCP